MRARTPGRPPAPGWRQRLHEIIFEADTPAGRAFDVALLVAILSSVLAVLLESMPELRQEYGGALRAVEWIFTGLFTVEYGLRLVSVTRPVRYAFSFFGLVDLLAIMPTYLALVIPAAQSLMVIRAIRLLRVFRILKLARFREDADVLIRALSASRRKITLFLGSLVLGYSIIAVPTGIVSVELAQVSRAVSTQACPACGRQGHDLDARYRKHCGAAL